MKVSYIGKPIYSVAINAATYVSDIYGPRIYAVSIADPCIFYVIDPLAKKCLKQIQIGIRHCWGIVSDSCGIVYIGGDRELYKFEPISNNLTLIGDVIPGETYIWRLAIDNDDQVYGGTYPGGKVFQYNLKTKTFRDYGNLSFEEQYVRCLDVAGNRLFAGTGATKPQLFEIDTISGFKKVIELPTQHQINKFIYDLDVIDTRLFIRLSPSNLLLVYDLLTENWIDQVENVMGFDVSPPSKNNKVYFTKDNYLHEYDLNTQELLKKNVSLFEPAKDYGWLELNEDNFPGESLISIKKSGHLWIYNPETNSYIEIDLCLEGAPVQIQSLIEGPKNELYIGGYLAGGLAKYDTCKNQFHCNNDMGQIENMTSYKNNIYMGVYPNAQIFRYNIEEKWNIGENPTCLFELGKYEQDRPFAMVCIDKIIALGTVPVYGELGGALTIYDIEKNKYEVHRNLIRNQSIISLSYSNGKIFGGTSIWGGLGVNPTESTSKLFIWDISKKKLVWEGTPLYGEKAIIALLFDANSVLWGLAGGNLFKFDLKRNKVMKIVEIVPVDWNKIKHVWRGGYLGKTNKENLIGNVFGKIFTYNILEDKLQLYEEKAYLMHRTRKGEVYYCRSSELYRIDNFV